MKISDEPVTMFDNIFDEEIAKICRKFNSHFFRVDQERSKKGFQMGYIAGSSKIHCDFISCIFWQHYPHQVSTLDYI